MTVHTFHPDLPPPANTVGAIGWLRANLVSSPINVILTAFVIYILWITVIPIVQWALIDADWIGTDQSACTSGGACWVFIKARMGLFIYGFFPDSEYWRIDILFACFAVLSCALFVEQFPMRKYVILFGLLIFPFIAYVLMAGGTFGLLEIDTGKWGGLSLTLILAFVGIIAALPIGILLALGRRSEMPVIRLLCIGFIELWRGVPLISVLFMASVMLPLFLPAGVTFDKLMRAMIGITMFQSAYMAEVVRGGLQAIPRGQTEAADALGLSFWKSMYLIVMPQALKLVIPGIVNTFIALFKDTTLVIIIGLFEILAAVQSAVIDPAWRSVSTEGYIFAALCFWVFCFGMSRYSQALERKLYTGHKR
jgi:general L-amino acid transport system permease protein